MIDVVTDLIGEIVEVHEWSHDGPSLRSRGTVRSVYVADKALMVLVEHDLGFDSHGFGFRAEDGGFAAYSFHEQRVRVVRRCARCVAWDLKSRMRRCPKARVNKAFGCTWEHKDGEGCRKDRT